MKKTFTFIAVAVFAMTSQGAQIAWNLSNVAFGGSKLADAGTEFVASLFYLGNGGSLAESYSADDIAALDIKESATGTTSKAANAGTYTLTEGSDKNGDVFGMLLSYTTGGKTYYNIAATTYTLSGFADATSTVDSYKLAASAMTYTTADASVTKASPGGGWTVVPEPSTAALALAGLALLLKRRKA